MNHPRTPESQPLPDDPQDDLPPLLDDETGEDDGEILLELPGDETDDLLDDSTLDEVLGPDELGIVSGTNEQGWTEESEGDETGREDDVEPQGSEYGWTTDMEEQGADDWDEELPTSNEPSVLEDSGEEGTDEETELDLTFEPLPDDEEDDDEEAASEAGTFDPESPADAMPLPPAHDESRIVLRAIGPAETVLSIVAPGHGGQFLAGGPGFFMTGADGTLAPAGRLEGEDLSSIAIDPADPAHIAVGTLLEGVLVSADAGRTFRPANSWSTARRRSSVSAAVTAWGDRLLVRTGDGLLFTSTDHGTSWTRVPFEGRALAHATVPSGRLHVLVETAGGPAIATSDDGGQRFTVAPPIARLKTLAAESEIQMAASAALIVIGAEELTLGTLASTDQGGSFVLWETAARASAIAIDPRAPRSCTIAVCRPARGLAAVLRTTDGGATFTTVFELAALRTLFHIELPLDAEVDSRINGLAFDGEGGTLLVASTAGGFVVQVRDEHDPA